MIITLMGTPSSGKSFLAREIAQIFHFPHKSIGDMRREAARARGMTLAEYNKLGETEDTDTEFDDFQKKYGEEHDDFVIDGRLSAFFIPQAIKVYIDADEHVRAERMLQKDPAHERIGEEPRTKEEAITCMRERVASDKKRYLHHYGFDPYDSSKYDLFLDTTHLDKAASVAALRKLIDEKIQ